MSKGLSLHIGLNSVDPAKYSGWSGDLVACENDARSMQSICSARGFQAHTLLTQQATRAALLDALKDASQELQAGDTLVISYSGHGGQVPDVNGDEDDGLDETWCLYDGEVLDDELYWCWGQLPAGVRVAVFSDSCHSGTVLKATLLAKGMVAADAGPVTTRYKAMPREVEFATYERNRALYEELQSKGAPPDPHCSVILVSGCQDNQLSSDGPFNGSFTGALLIVWQNGQFHGGYAEFTKAIRARLPSTQSPNFMSVGAPDPDFQNGPVFSI
jgi:metacaspase-1